MSEILDKTHKTLSSTNLKQPCLKTGNMEPFSTRSCKYAIQIDQLFAFKKHL